MCSLNVFVIFIGFEYVSCHGLSIQHMQTACLYFDISIRLNPIATVKCVGRKVNFLLGQFGSRHGQPPPNGWKKWRHPIPWTRWFVALGLYKEKTASSLELIYVHHQIIDQLNIWTLTLLSMLRPGRGFLSGPTQCPLACFGAPPLISPATSRRPAAPLPPMSSTQCWRAALFESEKYCLQNRIF